MERLDQKVCLDTDFVIAILNNEERSHSLIDKIEHSEVYITTVTLFELFLRETNLDKIEILRTKVKILDFNEPSSRKASMIFKDLRKKGRLMDIKDLFIASSCIAHNCVLATFNKKHFVNIKELKLVE